jgi:hypothetical protein
MSGSDKNSSQRAMEEYGEALADHATKYAETILGDRRGDESAVYGLTLILLTHAAAKLAERSMRRMSDSIANVTKNLSEKD